MPQSSSDLQPVVFVTQRCTWFCSHHVTTLLTTDLHSASSPLLIHSTKYRVIGGLLKVTGGSFASAHTVICQSGSVNFSHSRIVLKACLSQCSSACQGSVLAYLQVYVTFSNCQLCKVYCQFSWQLKICVQTCMFPCVAAQSPCQPVVLATLQHTGLFERTLFLHKVCFPFSSSLQTLFLPLFFLRLYLRLCSHADPPVHLTAQMATDKLNCKTHHFCSDRALSLALSNGLILHKGLESEGMGLSCVLEQEPEQKIVLTYGCGNLCHKKPLHLQWEHISLVPAKVRGTLQSIKQQAATLLGLIIILQC